MTTSTNVKMGRNDFVVILTFFMKSPFFHFLMHCN